MNQDTLQANIYKLTGDDKELFEKHRERILAVCDNIISEADQAQAEHNKAIAEFDRQMTMPAEFPWTEVTTPRGPAIDVRKISRTQYIGHSTNKLIKSTSLHRIFLWAINGVEVENRGAAPMLEVTPVLHDDILKRVSAWPSKDGPITAGGVAALSGGRQENIRVASLIGRLLGEAVQKEALSATPSRLLITTTSGALHEFEIPIAWMDETHAKIIQLWKGQPALINPTLPGFDLAYHEPQWRVPRHVSSSNVAFDNVPEWVRDAVDMGIIRWKNANIPEGVAGGVYIHTTNGTIHAPMGSVIVLRNGSQIHVKSG